MKLRGERASSKSRGHGASLAAPFSNAGRAPERRTRAPHPDLETRSFGGRLGAPGTAALTQRGSARRGVRAVTVGVATRNVSTDGDDTLHVRAAARRRAGTSAAGDCAADVGGSKRCNLSYRLHIVDLFILLILCNIIVIPTLPRGERRLHSRPVLCSCPTEDHY